MNKMRLQMTKQILSYVRLINNIQRMKTCLPHSGFYLTFTVDAFTSEWLEQPKDKALKYDLSELNMQHFATTAMNNISKMSNQDMDNMFTELLLKNKDKQIHTTITECQNLRKYLSFLTMKKLFKHYSQNGKPDMIAILQNYCAKVDPISYKRNGEFLHYLAKAQCMRGNSEVGLSILKSSYNKYESLRSLYRIIFRDLIQDSVLNRSEASLVVFKKYVIEFSETWMDHYPLICFWHMCWASTWFSDQTISNELLEASEVLQDIVRDKASAISIMALKDYNEDAVVRLLQTLLKYEMMSEYVAVLQVLFTYKLKNRDIRGCTEIVRNCEVLGVTLSSNQQGRYITMLIEGKNVKKSGREYENPTKPNLKHFKLKF